MNGRQTVVATLVQLDSFKMESVFQAACVELQHHHQRAAGLHEDRYHETGRVRV